MPGFQRVTAPRFGLLLRRAHTPRTEVVANGYSDKGHPPDAACRGFCRYRAGHQETYPGIIDAVFAETGLPCHISERAELAEKPVFKLILSAFGIKNNGWNTADIVSYMKTGLSPVTPDECDTIESYAYQWSISGKRWYDGEDWFMNPDGFSPT